MLDSTINLVKADLKDAELIEKLAHEIWHDYYPSIITVEQIDYMLNRMYNKESLTEQMTQKGDVFYLIHINNQAQGFISISDLKDGNYFLNKFYILQTNAAQGKGTRVFINSKKIFK